MITIVPVYAAVFAVMLVILSIRVIAMRYKERVSLGAGANKTLERRIRIHGNFVEYVPFALLVLSFIEWQGAPRALVHGLCIALLIGRVSHVLGLTEGFHFRLRQAGMILTFSVLLISAGIIFGTTFLVAR